MYMLIAVGVAFALFLGLRIALWIEDLIVARKERDLYYEQWQKERSRPLVKIVRVPYPFPECSMDTSEFGEQSRYYLSGIQDRSD